MKRFLLIALVLMGWVSVSRADHITGGEVYYTLAGVSQGQYRYNVTVRLFKLCVSDRQFNNPTIVSIFNAGTAERITDISVPIHTTERLNLTNTNPCITNPPQVCYEVANYIFDVTLPGAVEGYVITAHVVFRVDGMNNLFPGYNQVGATYTAIIPGTSTHGNTGENNSARFTGSDLVVVCSDNEFSYSFAAVDTDGDQLRYSFCEAYETNGFGGFGNNSVPPPPPPYSTVPYGNGFNGSAPLGNNVRIDPSTGIITGIAPAPGTYVVTVCVEEIRGGTVIATQRKDIQINITSCAIAAAALPPEYMLCGESTTLSARNLSTSPLISTYHWELINDANGLEYSSTDPRITYTFAAPGTYLVKLVINRNQQCADSTSSTVRVYPGFVPEFDYTGRCITNTTQFSDATTTVFGNVDSWRWDFGEPAVTNDNSILRNPSFKYPQTGTKQVRLIATNSVGCRDTITKSLVVFEKPPLRLAFRDTLICPPDNLRLQAMGTGSFSWSPGINISGSSTSSPVVSPVSNIKYYVDLNDEGCINRDSVFIRVVDQVTLAAMPDTTVCLGDPAQLHLVSDGLRFSWSPSATINNERIRNPVALPLATTTYAVTASISTCTATDFVTVNTVPYPEANAGPDTLICFNTSALLQASTDGSSFNWRPDPTLEGVNSLSPLATPSSSSYYTFYAFDTRGCPKPGVDSVLVTVLPKIVPFGGNDTTAVVGQPLQLQATGGIRYSWIPGVSLSASDVSNPIARFASPPAGGGYQPYTVLVYNEAGCVDSSKINVRVFATSPDIFVPSAFTPNGDGRNDMFKPVAAGVRQVELFRIYNRWGQLMYSSSSLSGRGWDGTHNGELQPAGTFVWMIKATDYAGFAILKKGTVTLIR